MLSNIFNSCLKSMTSWVVCTSLMLLLASAHTARAFHHPLTTATMSFPKLSTLSSPLYSSSTTFLPSLSNPHLLSNNNDLAQPLSCSPWEKTASFLLSQEESSGGGLMMVNTVDPTQVITAGVGSLAGTTWILFVPIGAGLLVALLLVYLLVGSANPETPNE